MLPVGLSAMPSVSGGGTPAAADSRRAASQDGRRSAGAPPAECMLTLRRGAALLDVGKRGSGRTVLAASSPASSRGREPWSDISSSSARARVRGGPSITPCGCDFSRDSNTGVGAATGVPPGAALAGGRAGAGTAYLDGRSVARCDT